MSASRRYPFTVEQSWGVASLRQCAGFPGAVLSEEQSLTYITPLGPLIVCWDISTREKKVCFQAHSDLIISLLHNKQYNIILSISYGGEIKLWTKNWDLLAFKNTTYGCTHFGAWSNDGKRFLICGGEESLVAVYRLETNEHEDAFDFELLWLQKGKSLSDSSSCSEEGSGYEADAPASSGCPPGSGCQPTAPSGSRSLPVVPADSGCPPDTSAGSRCLPDIPGGRSGCEPDAPEGSGCPPDAPTGSGCPPDAPTGSGCPPDVPAGSGCQPNTPTSSGSTPDVQEGSVCPPGSGCLPDVPAGPSQVTEDSNSVTYVKQRDWYDVAIFNSGNHVIALLQRVHNKLSEAHLYDESGQLYQTQKLDPIGNTKASIMCTTSCHNGLFAVGFQGGIFLILDEANLSVKAVFQATGSPQVALWDGNYILAMSYLSGIVTWWSATGELYYEICGAPRDSVVHLNWSTNKHRRGLWVGGIMSLSYITMKYAENEERFPCKLTEQYKLKFHSVTGCGMDVNKDGALASGDLTGNVFVWQNGRDEPLFKLKYEAAVRCITWNDNTLFIGCLDGMVLKWFPGTEEQISLACTGGVLTMRWSQNRLAIGLDNGYLLVYEFHGQELSSQEEIFNFKAHSMMRDEVIAPAEVWSVCWSPCCTMIATASEDHTTCIWNATSGKKLQTLHGHTTAVTSVDWKLMSSQRSILATCADDRTVRVIDSSTYDVIHVLTLPKVPGWYTLTYLSLNPIRQQCLCSTQNGRLALWDCMSGELLACRKVHCGSIEGLVYAHDNYTMCATVSSDCVVNMFSIHV